MHIYRLQNVVIDLEVAAGTPSPTVDPSVRTILIGHSMGGIVAADTLLAIASEPPIPSSSQNSTNSTSGAPSSPLSTHPFMFPFIQGILAFDTPYLGISPGVVAHGAENHYKTATTAYSTITGITSVFGWGAATSGASKAASTAQKAILPGPGAAKEALAASAAASSSVDAAATPAWQRWGKYAMYAGAAGAVAAGGAAAYLKRDTITEGWSWVGSHLEFVGCLMRGEDLKSRLAQVSKLRDDQGIGFADLFTVLGAAGNKPGTSMAGGLVEIGGIDAKDRTFCNIPKSVETRGFFEACVNEKAGDETVAHMSMFFPRDNPGYYRMSERAKDLVVEWVESGWYLGSEVLEKEDGGLKMDGVDLGGMDDWRDDGEVGDGVVIVD